MTPTFPLPPGTYFGGKNAGGVVHQIINQIPRHEYFVSGFLGRCAVMRYKKPADYNVGIDMDAAVIAEWREASGDDHNKLCLMQYDFLRIAGFGPLLKKSTFLYLDPPYLPETRTSNNQYNHELTHDQHFELLTKIRTLPCMVAISCYDSHLYWQMLHDWRKIQFQSQTRGGTRTETLYMNYPEPEPHELHDTRFLGSDFREREKGKRRIETIKGKIERLTPQEKARLSDWLRSQINAPESARVAGIAESSEEAGNTAIVGDAYHGSTRKF